MSTVALTTIRHGKKDGEVVTVPEGEKLPAGVFSKEELDSLKEQGLIGEPPATPSEVAATEEENALLKDRVAELERQLAEAKQTGSK